MQTITEQDWQTLPEPAQQELYEFFSFSKTTLRPTKKRQ